METLQKKKKKIKEKESTLLFMGIWREVL